MTQGTEKERKDKKLSDTSFFFFFTSSYLSIGTASYLEKVYYSIKTRHFLYNKLKHNILYAFQGAIVIGFQEIIF